MRPDRVELCVSNYMVTFYVIFLFSFSCLGSPGVLIEQDRDSRNLDSSLDPLSERHFLEQDFFLKKKGEHVEVSSLHSHRDYYNTNG
jgi:hypothetical protein